MNQRGFWAVLGAWTAIGLCSFSRFYTGSFDGAAKYPWYQLFLLEMLFWWALALCTPPIFALSARFPAGPPKTWLHLLAHSGFALVFTAGFCVFMVFYVGIHPIFSALFAPGDGWTARYEKAADQYALFCLIIYAVILAVGHAVNYYTQFRNRERQGAALQVQNSMLSAQLAEARLLALRMQIHPHFLFNTLHSVAGLIRDNRAPEAIRMISGLGDLLRMALDSSAEEETTLREELVFVRRYLDIEQVRFEDRLQTAIDAEDGVLGARVPRLILQPSVENAIRHGVSQRTASGRVSVKAWKRDAWLWLEVRDDGPGPPSVADSEETSGRGIKITKARLERLYSRDQSFSLEAAKDGGAIATIRIPFEEAGLESSWKRAASAP